MLARRFAAELGARGIVKGDRVLLWGSNSAEWVGAFFGCVLRGVLPVPLDVAGSPEFACRVIAETAPKLAVLGSEQHVPSVLPRLLFHELTSSITDKAAGALDGLQASDPLQVIFTSGTTSEPKGVVHTHNNVLASLRPIETELQKYMRYERIFHPIRFLHTLPLSHVFGQFMGLWIPPLLAAEVHFDDDLVAERMIAHIKSERISLLACVPRVLDLLHNHVTALDPGLQGAADRAIGISAAARWWRFRRTHRAFGLKFWAMVCGGASLPAGLEEFWGRLGFVVVQGYGMTETTALVSLNHPFKAAHGTVGQVLPGREVRLGEDGELLVRGETVSNATWRNGRVEYSPEEWLATGDLAERDADGNLRFRGRKKETIVTASGLNIYPEDVEAALLGSPGVRGAAVVGLNDSPYAVLLIEAGSDPEEAVSTANANLADFQRVQRWSIWPEADFPRTSTGKVSKREIVDRLTQGVAAEGAVSGGDELELDSLGRVELQARVEQQFGVSLDDEALQRVRTRTELHQLLASRPATPRRNEHLYWKWPWTPVVQVVRSLFLELVALPLVRFLTRAQVRSQVVELPNGPVLIVANHITTYDVPLVLYALPGRFRRRVAVAMSGEMLRDYRGGRNQGNWFLDLLAPAAYWLITALFNVFPLPRGGNFRDSFRHAGEALDRGFSLVVFPEGHRSDDGNPQPFRAGVGVLWKDLRVPVLAVHLGGLGAIKAQGGRWFRRGNIIISLRQVLPLEPTASVEELTQRLRHAVFSTEELAREAAKQRNTEDTDAQ
jgi:long-chain acyl-CoA synthetase